MKFSVPFVIALTFSLGLCALPQVVNAGTIIYKNEKGEIVRYLPSKKKSKDKKAKLSAKQQGSIAGVRPKPAGVPFDHRITPPVEIK